MFAIVTHLKSHPTNELHQNHVAFIFGLLNSTRCPTAEWFSCIWIIKKSKNAIPDESFQILRPLISARRGLFTKMVSHERSKVSGPDAGEFSFHTQHLDVTHDGWTPPPVGVQDRSRELVACRFPVYRYTAPWFYLHLKSLQNRR